MQAVAQVENTVAPDLITMGTLDVHPVALFGNNVLLDSVVRGAPEVQSGAALPFFKFRSTANPITPQGIAM